MKRRFFGESDLYFVFDIIVRYLVIILAGLGNLYIFYLLFRGITISAVSFVVSLFVNVTFILPNTLYINQIYFEFVNACIGGSAYYLLFILAMSCRDLVLKKRLFVIFWSFLALFVFNVFRIILMIVVAHEVYFTLVHWVFWYFLATAFVFIDWVIISRKFNIESIPVYSDVVYITSAMFGIKGTHRSKKRHKKGKVKKSSRKKSSS